MVCLFAQLNIAYDAMMNINELTHTFLELNQELIKNRDIKSLVNLVPHVMEYVESFEERMPGEEKKRLVVDIVDRIFDETTIGGPLDPIIDAIAKVIVPELIEIFISIAKGLFKIHTESTPEDDDNAPWWRACYSGCAASLCPSTPRAQRVKSRDLHL